MNTDYSGREYLNTERGHLVSILDRVGDSYQYRAYKPANDEITAGCITRRTLERAVADGVYVRATVSRLNDSRRGGER
jgi:hypothetical protein